MGEVRQLSTKGPVPCKYCEGEHIWSACPRIRRMQFFGQYEGSDDIEAIEFWPPDGFEFEIPDDDLLLKKHDDEGD